MQGAQQWTGYAYLHDDRDLASASSATYGVRWSGKALQQGNGPGWTLELARQQDYADNPLHFSHRYWLAEPSWSQAGITAKLGWEHLGGNGQHALQTPWRPCTRSMAGPTSSWSRPPVGWRIATRR